MKNKFNLFLLLGFTLFAFNGSAQEVEGFEKVLYYPPADMESEGINLSIKNAVAQADHSKLALTVENGSTDLLMYVPNESVFTFAFGENSDSMKSFILKPGDKKTKTLMAKGSGNYLQKEFQLTISGLYKIPVNGKVTEAEQFALPAAKNGFTAGNFKVQLKKYSASTKEAKAVFEVTYLGDEIALIDPTSLSVTAKRNKSTDEVTYANDDKKSEIEILRKNETVEFSAVFHIPGKIVDMQFATLNVNWNETFVETTALPIEAPVFKLEMDDASTRAAN